MKPFLTNKQLLEKLEKRAGISFSKPVIELFAKKGYHRIKNTLMFMINNNIEITNISIKAIYINEKHFRHMLMPRIESFEMVLKNNIIHEITRTLSSKDNIFKGLKNEIFIKDKKQVLITRINSRLKKVYRNDNFNVTSNKHSIFH